MWRSVQAISRTISRQDWVRENICHKCLSTSSSLRTPTNNNNNNNNSSYGYTVRRGFADTTGISRVDLAPSRTGSEFGEAQTRHPHPGVLEPSAVKGKSSKSFFSSSTSHSQHHLESEINIAVEQVPIPDYEEKLSDGEVFRGLESNFPCRNDNKDSGPEPEYDNIVSGYKTFQHAEPFYFKYRQGVVPEVQLAYETWGTLNEHKDNAVLLFTGLSASSHAKSHEDNPKPGWWEKFVGPGCALDTDEFFVICVNNLGGCYGSTGPSSINPLTDMAYGTNFPLLSVEDIVRSQFLLLDHLGIEKLYASVGSSLGGMLSLTSAVLYPARVNRTICISSCAQSHPTSIAMRYLQRKAIMMDPAWDKGHFYDTGKYPKTGMKLAREIATLTYRSGPEWEERFGRKRIDDNAEPSLCPNFMIENYLDHQGEAASTKLDPNTLIYISKAMDLFDLSETFGSLHVALSRVRCPTMIIGVQTDILFPVWQQRELANILQEAGNNKVTYYELNSIYGHDTFLLDLSGVGAGVKGFLETQLKESGRVRQRQDRK